LLYSPSSRASSYLQVKKGKEPRSDHDYFLKDAAHFIIHQLPYHSAPDVFDTDSVVKYSTKEEATSNILNSDDKISKVIKTD